MAVCLLLCVVTCCLFCVVRGSLFVVVCCDVVVDRWLFVVVRGLFCDCFVADCSSVYLLCLCLLVFVVR